MRHRLVNRVVLLLFDSLGGACCSARTAFYTCISVDYILAVAFSNDANGAGVCTGAAAYTSVSNEICHLSYLQIVLQMFAIVIVAHFLKNAITIRRQPVNEV